VIGVVVGALVVLLLAAGAAYALLRDDDDARAGSRDPAVTGDSSPGESGSPGGSDYRVKPEDEKKAIASFATALVKQLRISRPQAACLAFQVIRGVGLQRMVDIGMFDRHMKFLDVDLGDYPDVKEAINTAALTCISPS
jgi:hypothetical protein